MDDKLLEHGLHLVKADNVPLSEKAAEQIIRYIQENRLQRGDRLPNEKELVEQLNVSRSTIREAMRSLSSRGIVVIRQGSGTYLSSLPGVSEDPLGLEFKYDKEKVLKDMVEIRLIMEPSIAASCARRVTDAEIEELNMLAEQISQSIVDGADHLEYDVQFHRRIAEITGNDIVNVLYPEIIKGIRMFTEFLGDTILNDVGTDHERIAKAISERDTQRAYNAMLYHLDANRHAIEEFFRMKSEQERKES